jgi:uncharacterized membrane protein
MWPLSTYYNYDVAHVNMVALYFWERSSELYAASRSRQRVMLPMSTRRI